jgi:tetratricopeptide (TPR) repeat protein
VQRNFPVRATQDGAGTPAIFLEIDWALRANDIERATTLACRALDAGHRRASLFSLRAHAAKKRGAFAAALEDFRAALALDPKSAFTQCDIADCLNWLGRPEEADIAAEAALKLDRKAAPGWYQKAMAAMALVDYSLARECFEKSLALDPNSTDAHGQLASLEAGQGNYAKAREHAAQALARNPRHTVAILALAAADLHDGRLADVERALQSVLTDREVSAPLRATAAGLMGDLRDAQDRTGLASAAYAEARRVWAAHYDKPVRDRAPEFGHARVLRLAAQLDALGGQA